MKFCGINAEIGNFLLSIGCNYVQYALQKHGKKLTKKMIQNGCKTHTVSFCDVLS